MPAIKPAAIAKKIVPISLAVPGTERNLTSEKAPATATPAPTLPFTIIITMQTTAGSRARVTTKLAVYLLLKVYTQASAPPITSETAMHNTNCDTDITDVAVVSKSPVKILLSIIY